MKTFLTILGYSGLALYFILFWMNVGHIHGWWYIGWMNDDECWRSRPPKKKK